MICKSFPHEIVSEYRILEEKGEGTFSRVVKAQSQKRGTLVAVKMMKNKFETLEEVNSLREIQALRRLMPHPNIISMLEVQ